MKIVALSAFAPSARHNPDEHELYRRSMNGTGNSHPDPTGEACVLSAAVNPSTDPELYDNTNSGPAPTGEAATGTGYEYWNDPDPIPADHPIDGRNGVDANDPASPDAAAVTNTTEPAGTCAPTDPVAEPLAAAPPATDDEPGDGPDDAAVVPDTEAAGEPDAAAEAEADEDGEAVLSEPDEAPAWSPATGTVAYNRWFVASRVVTNGVPI
jgi:hypothetical protein